jgi:hypothetical protein
MRRVAHAAALLLLILGSTPLAASGSLRSVTVTGWGTLEGDRVDEARARAVADALGRVVQQAGRTLVASDSRLVDDWELSSSVAIQTLGMVRGFRILSEGMDRARGYRVTLVAQVASDGDAGRTKASKVLVLGRESYRGTHTPPQGLGAEIAKRLREKGYGVVTLEPPRALPRSANQRGELSAGVVRALATEHEADLVATAWAEAWHSDTANASLHSARAAGRVRVYSGSTGEVLGSKAAAETLGWGPTPERAGEAALADLSKALALHALVLVTVALSSR